MHINPNEIVEDPHHANLAEVDMNGNPVNMAEMYLKMLMNARVPIEEHLYSPGLLLIGIDYQEKGINAPEFRLDDYVHLSVALLNTRRYFNLIQASNIQEVFVHEFEEGNLAVKPSRHVLQEQLMLIPGFEYGAGNARVEVADVLDEIFEVEWAREY